MRLGQPPVPDLPIWIAALGNLSVSVAAELADGWFPAFVARDRFAGWIPALNQKREAAGIRSGRLLVAAGPTTAADQDEGRARDLIAGNLAWYLCAMGDVYARSVSDQGYRSAVDAVVTANPRPSMPGGVVPAEADVLLDQLTVYGRPSHVRRQLEAWDSVVDVVMIGLVPAVPWNSIEATIRAAAP